MPASNTGIQTDRMHHAMPMDNPSVAKRGCGHDLSIRELAETIASQCNYTGTIKWDTSKADGTPRKLLDISRIQSLGWSPSINLEESCQVLADLPQAIANGR